MNDKRVQNMLDWQNDHLGDLVYSQSDPYRLSTSHLFAPTDCSGLFAKMMAEFADGLYVGTYTGNECTYGDLITTDRNRILDLALPGDGLLYNWYYDPDGPWNHINMYAGNGEVLNHGGPGKGPVRQSLASNLSNARHVMLRRYLHPVVPPKPTPIKSHSPDNPLNGRKLPPFIWPGSGDYIGVYWGPNESHGGYYEAERPYIILVEKFLGWKYPKLANEKGLVIDGKFGTVTRDLVSRFQHEYLPEVKYFGQVWHNTWTKMASF